MFSDDFKFMFFWKFIERPKRIFQNYIDRFLNRDNEILIQREVDKHRNELVIAHSRIVQLLGWTKQYDDDYYWVIYVKRTGVELHSCVGGFKYLKGQLQGFDYYQLKHWWDINPPDSKQIQQEVKEKGIELL